MATMAALVAELRAAMKELQAARANRVKAIFGTIEPEQRVRRAESAIFSRVLEDHPEVQPTTISS